MVCLLLPRNTSKMSSAGPWIIKAFKRHRRDLEHGHTRGLRFEPDAGQFKSGTLRPKSVTGA